MSTDGVSRAIRWRASHNSDISTQAHQPLRNVTRSKYKQMFSIFGDSSWDTVVNQIDKILMKPCNLWTEGKR
jgi:hypothetical protein